MPIIVDEIESRCDESLSVINNIINILQDHQAIIISHERQISQISDKSWRKCGRKYFIVGLRGRTLSKIEVLN